MDYSIQFKNYINITKNYLTGSGAAKRCEMSDHGAPLRQVRRVNTFGLVLTFPTARLVLGRTSQSAFNNGIAPINALIQNSITPTRSARPPYNPGPSHRIRGSWRPNFFRAAGRIINDMCDSSKNNAHRPALDHTYTQPHPPPPPARPPHERLSSS